ncbi:Putative peptidase family-protein [Tolypocladium paradoxum]|uniref:Peptidase family-protein n=1 Tax=Tolypocladium paradoxum TaxID=94208 RepID=A0A2S4KYP3_9HYPO|nr:Putative peptidase family-protein [Tolypocladium paradoxum]
MLFYASFTACLLLPGALGSPLVPRAETTTAAVSAPKESGAPNKIYDWSDGWKTSFTIHPSCNSTLRAQLQQGLDEAVQLAKHAKDHLLRFGNHSEFTQKYFGNGTTATPIGWYERIIAADKTGMLFRCDDPDRNCQTQDSWAGHWRGANATAETVICPLSFHLRRPLSSVCNLGYTVAESKLNTYWATDLMHRILHVPIVSEGIVDHFAADYPEVVALAKSQSQKSGIDSDTLQYFAIDVWAYDIAAPGVGCTGKPPKAETSTKPTPASSSTPSATKSATTECHTHADGALHCS